MNCSQTVATHSGSPSEYLALLDFACADPRPVRIDWRPLLLIAASLLVLFARAGDIAPAEAGGSRVASAIECAGPCSKRLPAGGIPAFATRV